MSQQDRDAKAAAVMSSAAAIAAALAYVNSRKAARPGGELALPDEFVQLIIAMAASAGVIEDRLEQVITALSSLGMDVQGWPQNTKYIRTFTIVCAIAGTPYRASEMEIPSGMNLVIKSHPINAVGSLVQVAATAANCVNVNSSYPLVPNEAMAYALQNSKEVFVSSNAAGSIVIFTAEQVT